MQGIAWNPLMIITILHEPISVCVCMLGIKQKILGILELQRLKSDDFVFNIIFLIIFNSIKTNKQQQKQLWGMILWQTLLQG